MSFRTRFTSLCNLMFSCLWFTEELSEQSHNSDVSVPCDQLPDSVIHEILMKLPIKSVVRCRRVCKAWYQLILDPYFANVYFKSSPFNVTAISQHVAYDEGGWMFVFPESSFRYIEIGRNDNSCNVKALSSPGPKKRKDLLGSCDGLLCFVENIQLHGLSVDFRAIIANYVNPTHMNVCIVNPLMGEYKALPRVRELGDNYLVYGFGSTIDGDHYKVIKIGMNSRRHTSKADILTIGVDKYWREVDISSMPLFLYSHGVILNGVLHWLGDDDDGTPHGVIYAFDIQNEKGKCFSVPSAVGRRTREIYLVVRNGHLCITDCRNKQRQVDIWTMKIYGEVESWIRDVIILPNDIIGISSEVLIPITTMKNGHLLLSLRKSNMLFSCDPKTMNCVEVKDIHPN